MDGPRRTRSLWTSLALAITAVAGAEGAEAHGRPPAVLGLMTSSVGGSEDAARLSRGVAIQKEGAWRFVCPDAWGGPETPLAAADAEGVWIAADAGLVRLDLDTLAVSAVDAGEGRALDLVSSDAGPLAVLEDGADSRLIRFDGDGHRELARLPGRWPALAASGERIALARAEGSNVHLELRDREGAPLESLTIDAELDSPTVELRPAGERLFLLLATPDRYALKELVEDTLVPRFSHEEPILGPIALGESVVAGAAGEVFTLKDGAIVPAGLPDRVTCLGQSPQGSWACTLFTVFPLESDVALGDPLLTLAQISPLPTESVGADPDACEAQWRDFATDAGLNPGLAADDVDSTTDATSNVDGGGCAQAPGGGHGGLPAALILGLLAFSWSRRATR